MAALLLLPSLGTAQQQPSAQDPDTMTPPSPPTVTQPASKPSGSSRAAGAIVDATGPDNFGTADFYGVANSGTDPIVSITWDLSATAGSFFDFDGGANFGSAFDPVIGATGGMGAGDVTWSYGPMYDHPAIMTATISPPMAPGAFFRFGADTDFFVSDPCPGGNFALGGAVVSITYASGSSASDVFTFLSSTASEIIFGSVFTLSTTGAPGGGMTFDVTGGTPSGPIIYLYAFGLGSKSGTNPFTGSFIITGLSTIGFTVAGVIPADGGGSATFPSFVPASAVGLVSVQALDGMSDALSNIISL